jgi:nanoRNase/pAp phosphatase (c-di-AMP/oligoRNAs hydrolase)
MILLIGAQQGVFTVAKSLRKKNIPDLKLFITKKSGEVPKKEYDIVYGTENDLVKFIKSHKRSLETIVFTNFFDPAIMGKVRSLVRPNTPFIYYGRDKEPQLPPDLIDYSIQVDDIAVEVMLNKIKQIRGQKLWQTLKGILQGLKDKKIGILLHDNPDPDAISSGQAFACLAEKFGAIPKIYYGGRIGFPQNQILINFLGLQLLPLKSNQLEDLDAVVLIDTATVPGEKAGPAPTIVIDHHEIEPSEVKGQFIDIRQNGATATILFEYLTLAGIKISKNLAVALIFGILTDTDNFLRNTTEKDLKAFSILYPEADNEILHRILKPEVSTEALEVLSTAIKNRCIKGSILIANVGFIENRDTLPQSAEQLVHLEGILTAIVYGITKENIEISGRTYDMRVNLGKFLKNAFHDIGSAGGHSTAGAARIPLGPFKEIEDKEKLLQLVSAVIEKRIASAQEIV